MVIIGSGAGGGTVAHELATRGVRCVVLEAGPYLVADDYENDEWAAFNQMAWLDLRTTSGSWRVAQDFPNLPTWIVKAVGGSTTHWSGATPRFKAHEFRTRTTYGEVDGANLLDWPITLDDLAPYYDTGRDHHRLRPTGTGARRSRPATTTTCWPTAPSGSGTTSTPPARTAPTPNRTTDGRPRSRTASTSRATRTGPSGAPGSGRSRGPWPPGTATCGRTVRPCRSPTTTAGPADAVLYLDGGGQPAPAAGPGGLRGRQLDRDAAAAADVAPARCSRTGWRTPRARSAATTCGTPPGRCTRQFEQPVNMYRGETMAGMIADESRHDPSRGFAGGYYLETLSLGVPFLAAFIEPGAWGPAVHRDHGGYANTAGMWIVGEDMPQETNRVTLNTDGDRQARAAGAERALRRPPERRRDARPRLPAGRAALRGGRRDQRAPHAAVPVDAQPRHLPG